MIDSALIFAQSDAPAAGAELAQVAIATGAAVILTAALLIFGLGHRSGRIGALGRLAAFSERMSGMPGWAALPVSVAGGALLVAVFGMYWDISLHIDNGRDPGPLANPSHYFILGGLFGIFAAGWLSIVLPQERPGPAAVRITGDWYAPVSGILMAACAGFSLLGFPLDDVSHRLFGQDVTLWGPTHLMLLTGAGLTLITILGLFTEGRLAVRDRAGAGEARRRGLLPLLGSHRFRILSACGGLLIGLSVYQGEFDFGVPQFRLLFHPALIAFAAGGALVAARLIGGRGTALGAAIFFLVIRGGLALTVGPVLGETTPMLPLYLTEALIVEGVALALGTARPYRFAVWAGAGIGTLGVLSEWAWTQVAMPIAWPSHLIGEAILVSVPIAIAAATLGTFAAGGLKVQPAVTSTRRPLLAALASLAVIGGVAAYLLITTVPAGSGATVQLTEVAPEPDRQVEATVRFDPPELADDADWLNVTAWQGGDPLVLEELEPAGDGTWTAGPIPVSGDWKAGVRLHRGQTLATVPVYAPADDAIPVDEIPAESSFDRPLVGDHEFLQRERKEGVAGWIWGAAGIVVGGTTLVLLLMLGWGLRRIARRGAEGEPPATDSASPDPAAGKDRSADRSPIAGRTPRAGVA